MEQWNSTQPSDGMTFDHVMRWKIKNIKVQLSQRLQSLNVILIINHKWNTYQNETLPIIQVKRFNQVIISYTTTKLGGNAYQNQRVPLLHFTWPNHAKAIHMSNQATNSKLALMKSSHSYRTGDLWLCDFLINEERQIITFTKAWKL